MRLVKHWLLAASVTGALAATSPLLAQEEATAPSDVDVKALVERLEKAEAEIQRLRNELTARESSTQSIYGKSAITPASANATVGLQERLRILEEKWRNFEAAQTSGGSGSTDGKPTVKVGGRIMVDSAYFGQDSVNRATVGDIEDGVDFRRARIKVEGDAYQNMFYRIEMDFAAGGRPSFTDVYLGVRDVPVFGNVQIGHFKEPFSLEELTSSRFITFMERALPIEAFSPARNTGIMAYDHTPDLCWTWAIGWFRTNSDAWGDDVGDDGEQSVTARVTYNPWYVNDGEGVLHIGGAYSYRNSDEGVFRWRSRPEIRMAAAGEGAVPRFVNTGFIPSTEAHLLGGEAALVYGPFSVQSEIMLVPTNQIGTGNDPLFVGTYIYASYFLTGEHRNYNREHGVFSRVTPNQNFLTVTGDGCTLYEGWGAWEVALRWSYLDLNDELILGGRLHDLTLGVNWYLNPHARLMFNYIHAFLDDPVFDDSDADIVGMRAQIDF